MDVNAGPVKEGHECDVLRLGPRHLQVGLWSCQVKDLGWAVHVMASICEIKTSKQAPTTSAGSSSSDSDSVTESSVGEDPRSGPVMS
jgi:hypothetical protein